HVLNAGMTVSAVQLSEQGGMPGRGLLARARGKAVPVETSFLIHSDLFKTLLLYRAGASASASAVAAIAERPLPDAAPIRASLGPSPAALRPDHLLTNGRNGNGSGLAHSAAPVLAARLRHELMAAMGLAPAAIDDIWHPEIGQAVLAAAAVLKRQAR